MKMHTIGLALALIAVLAATDGDVRDALERGNAHFEQGLYQEALDAFDEAAESADESLRAELLHNRAAAQFKLGHTDDARELWVRSLPIRDEPFEARGRYNLGNCDYADALAALEAQDANKALELLDVATDQYRQAIRLDPELANARANLELA
ncbi:MAG: tetratricopeptide repeat protein, partial [Planctomycetes bacterium]|nr:tetratricopeptide repeat protein [Planctomycetota bacterium]